MYIRAYEQQICVNQRRSVRQYSPVIFCNIVDCSRKCREHIPELIHKMAHLFNIHSVVAMAFIIFSIFPSVNGNTSPVFDPNNILDFSELLENRTNGFHVGDILATDSDAQTTLTYGIARVESEYLGSGTGDAFDFLRVETENNIGKVYVENAADREVYNQLKASWTVGDGTVIVVKTPPVTIYVIDVNDNAPVFTNLPNRLESALPENTTNGRVVLPVTLTDEDGGANGAAVAFLTEEQNVFCDLDTFRLVENAENDFSLVLDKPLDYDKQSEYTVCLQATDGGNPPLSSDVRRVIISILDVQNLPPVFLNQPYDKTIDEDLEEGEEVLTVTAQDGDRGVPIPNAIMYSIDSEAFQINSSTGVVTVKSELDRETVSQYILFVNATEEDPTQPAAQVWARTQLFITIADVDDNPPVFDPSSTTATIAENAAVNSALNLDIEVEDKDSPEFAAIHLTLEQPFPVFRLQNSDFISSGRVDVRVNDSSYLDFEERTSIALQIVATSGNESDVADITVMITDENDNTPAFTQTEYVGNFTEYAKEGHFILQVQAEDDDGDSLVYSTSSTEFAVDADDGNITTKNVEFDAEVRTEYTFTVICSDKRGRSASVLVTLTCNDENDNSPQFQRSEIQIFEEEFDEIANMPDDAIGNVLAIDFDISEPNNVIRYSILSGNEDGKFKIDAERGDIFFNGTVDYEKIQQFNLTILAEDEGEPPLYDMADVTVIILDINDNPPEFEENIYYFAIPENASNGDPVGQVHATDEDSGFNGQVTYFIRSGSMDDFSIGSDGVLVVSGILNREETQSYVLEVVASDRGTPLREATCTVNIRVTDVNDEPPQFNRTVYEESVDEDEDIGTPILQISAFDVDEDSDLRYSIESITPDIPNQFSINNTTGEIYVGIELDYESNTFFTLEVGVEDLNTVPSGNSKDEATVTIAVNDVNDNPPVFQNTPYDLSADEESTKGTVISTVIEATDRDEGINAAITYSLDDDAGGLFTIDGQTGTLFVENIIDREKVGPLLTIVIRATDGGDPDLNATVEANVTISDINDNSPVFDGNSSCTHIAVNENSEPGSTTGCTVVAVDEDPVFGDITYSIQGGNIFQWFDVNGTTGEITIGSQTPNRETADQVIITVKADDGQRTATQDVNITILDENDNAPEFTVFIEFIETTESTGAGVVLTQVLAEDADEANTNASEVRYEITDGNRLGLFTLDEESGELSTKESLQTAAGTYKLEIQAYDLGTPSMRSEPKEMEIFVQDINDNQPVFIYPVPEPGEMTIEYIREGYVDINTTLFVANATDSDEGANGEIFYSFVEVGPDWSKFQVDSKSGKVSYIAEPPDWFTQNVYQLTLEAKNENSENTLSALVNFEVHVIDTMDTPPYFWDPNEPGSSPPVTELEKSENTDGEVGRVEARDEDNNQDIYYFIVDGNEEGLFTINKTSGVISTTEMLTNTNGVSEYTLIIKATNDSDFQPEARRRRATASATYDPDIDPSLLTVRILVLDENDNPPIFTESLYTAGVLYTVDFDVVVLQVSTTDLDTDEGYRMVEYTIDSQRRITPDNPEGDDDTAFDIISETGEIITKASFLSLSEAVYFEMVVSATDPTESAFTNTTDVFISVITESQQLKIHVDNTADEVRAISSDLERLFEEILVTFNSSTDVSVDFDKIATYTEDGTTPVPSQSEIIFHVVDLNSYLILDPNYVLNAIDHSFDYTDTVKGDYWVLTIELASPPPEVIDLTFFQWIVLALAIAFLLLLLLVLLAFYFSKKQHERVLRAYGIKQAYDIPDKIDKLPTTNTYASHNPVFEQEDVYEGALDDEPDPPSEKAETASSASEEVAMEMDDDEADYYEQMDDKGGNTNQLNTMLELHDRNKEKYAHTIHMPGLEVSDV